MHEPGQWAEKLPCGGVGKEGRGDAAAKASSGVRCGGLQPPALTSSSLRDPVLSCPEALHCAQLGAAQYRMHRGGSRQEARRDCGPSAALTGLLPFRPPGRLWAERQASRAFCVQQKAGLCLCSQPPEVLTGRPEIPQLSGGGERTGGSAIG